MEWLKKLAPTVASALLGPLGGLAVDLIGPALGLGDATVETVKDVLTKGNLTPEQIMAIKNAEIELKKHESEMGFKFADLEFQKEKLYVEDTADARHAHAQNMNVFWLGVATITAFAGMMTVVLLGCYFLLTQGIPIKDVNIVAVVFTLIGSVVTAVTQNAQQVYGFFFGSSRGSTDSRNALSAAVQQMTKIVQNQPSK